MRPGTKLALTGSVLASLAALAVWINSRAAPAVPAPAAAATGRSIEAADAAHSGANANADGGVDASGAGAAPRTVVPPPPEAAAVPPGIGDHPFALGIDVEVVDGRGSPVPRQTILLAPIGVDLHRGEHETDHNGRLSLRWRARRPSQLVAVGLAAAQRCDVVLVNHGAVRRVVLGMGRGGGALSDSQQELVAARALEVLATDEGSAGRRRSRARGTPVAHLGPLHPFAWFGEHARLRRIEVPRSADPIAISGLTIAALQRFTNLRIEQGEHQLGTYVQLQLVEAAQRAEWAPLHLELRTRADLAEVLYTLQANRLVRAEPTPPPAPALRGIVRDETGAPAAGLPVAWRVAEDRAWAEATTGHDGTFELLEPREGNVILHAAGGALGVAERSYSLLPGTTTHAELQLWRGRIVRGVAVDAAGSPLAGHIVEWSGADFDDYGVVETGADGRFELPNRKGPGRLWLMQGTTDVPLAVSPVVHPDGAEILLQAEPTGGSLALQPVLAKGCEAFHVRAFVWDTATGIGRRIAPDGEGRIVLQQMRAGTYRVVVHADALAAIDLGAHWIDGSNCRDLGPVAWPAPGDVTFERGERDGDKPVEELHRVGADFDVRIDGFTADTTKLSLAAGTYLWSWRDGNAAAQSQTFAVEPGAAIALRR